MQINASSANSINFIEQKKLNASSFNKTNNKNSDIEDSFLSKTISSIESLELNESLGTLQIAQSTVHKLKTNTQELQKLTEKFSFFQSQEIELSEKFENITINMLDIVDNTMVKDKQLFYNTHLFKSGSIEFKLTMENDYGIEDLNLTNSKKINDFEDKLSTVKNQIDEIKSYIELTNFNQMAALKNGSPLLDITKNSTNEKVTLNVEDIKRAHNTNSLIDKVDFLLRN